MKLDGIAGFRIVANDDAEALVRFYAALGFESDSARPIAAAEMALLGLAGSGTRRSLRLGDTRLDIDRYERRGQPYPSAADASSPCFQHLALVASDVDAAWARALRAGAVAISRSGPVTLPASAGSVRAVKFRDPHGHPLELIWFPDGPERGWTGEGAQGVDHSAVSVSDLTASRAFYEGIGLVAEKATLNRGTTQMRLDGLDDVHVDVVPMQPADPRPHLELLHYRGRSATPCAGWAVEDVVATRIVWRGSCAALLRDPDGHFHQVDAR